MKIYSYGDIAADVDGCQAQIKYWLGFFNSCYSQSLDITTYLSEGKNYFHKNTINFDQPLDDDGNTLLHLAISKDMSGTSMVLPNFLREMMGFGANLDVVNNRGETLLHVAARRTRAEVIRILLSKEPYLEWQDTDGNTALHIAVQARSVNVIQALLEAGADIKMLNKEGQRALTIFDAVVLNNADIINRLIKAGEDIEQRNAEGLTPLICAASTGRNISLRCLIDVGGDIEAKDPRGQTALELASANGYHPCVMPLAKVGAWFSKEWFDRRASYISKNIVEQAVTARVRVVSSVLKDVFIDKVPNVIGHVADFMGNDVVSGR